MALTMCDLEAIYPRSFHRPNDKLCDADREASLSTADAPGVRTSDWLGSNNLSPGTPDARRIR